MAGKQRKAPEAFKTPATDGPSWVGKALIAALKQSPLLSEPLARLVQEHAGPHRTLDLINSLSEVGITVSVTMQKKELSEEEKERRRENLKKAREAKQAKAKKGSP